MVNTAELLTAALEHHRAGDLVRAEAMYRQLLGLDPTRADAWFLLGLLCQSLGRVEETARCYRQALRLKPHCAEAHNNLGVALEGQGEPDQAVGCYREALRLKPAYVEALNNLGAALVALGQPEEALACCREALRLWPDYAKAHNNLGLALAAQGRADEALASYERAEHLQPGYAEAHVNKGVALADQGKVDEAVACYQQALRLNPESAEAHNNLGIARALQGERHEAQAHYREALRLKPPYPEALNNLGELLQEQGQVDDALALHRQALQLKPDFVAACNNFGNALWKKGQCEEAVACYQRALELDPRSAEAHNNLGLALALMGQFDDALVHYQEAVRLKPDSADAFNNLANAYKDQGRLDDAMACYRRAVALKPRDAALHSNLLFALHYDPRYAPAAIFVEHRRWAQQHAEPLAATIQPHAVDRTPGRRLRIGYVSPDFRHHVVAAFIEPILCAHDHDRFEITCYADVPRPDPVTQRLRGSADHWHSLVGLSDAEVVELIRHDRIDILVDLAGHTASNRLLVFVRKPAPIQVTYLGYPDTTGLPTIDYRLTDARADPPGTTDRYYTEKLIRLPEIHWCYRPSVSPEVEDLPALDTGCMTCGSLNNLAKVTPEVIALWSRILIALPDARIVLATDAGREGDRRILAEFARQEIDSERVTLLSKRPHDQYLQLYHRLDIGLDPFPFTGCTTTCDALWMGVPVITLAGTTCVSRQGVSLLSHLGLHELIAETPDAYVEIATRLASDLPKLRALRSGLRERMRRSTLTDAHRFTRGLEDAYRRMWERWCA